jgi:3-oxoacyl-[acyl-carrier protein] reductase
MRLHGRVAVVSGASRNIGKAVACTFARHGADLALIARETGDDLQVVAEECRALGVKVSTLLADVADYEQVGRLVDQVLSTYGKIDILVSNAAIRPYGRFWEISYEDWHRVMAVNLHATFYLAKAAAPGMIERGRGSIVAMGGLASLTGEMHRAHVVASKTGLYGLIRAMAKDLGPHGVRANLIAVGPTDTERRHPEWYPEAAGQPHTMEEIVATTALRRWGTPQDVANVALFFASDESSNVTGDRVICAGGKFM